MARDTSPPSFLRKVAPWTRLAAFSIAALILGALVLASMLGRGNQNSAQPLPAPVLSPTARPVASLTRTSAEATAVAGQAPDGSQEPCPCTLPVPTDLIPTRVAGGEATAAVIAPTPVPYLFGLAWFHKPANNGSSAGDIASQHRYIHLTGPSDIPFRKELRAAGYAGPIYTYVAANSVEGPGPYKDSSAPCAAGYQAYDNNLAWQVDDFCRYIHPHESWFLHNSKGERIFNDYFHTERWGYLMNPVDAGWRDFSYSRLKTIYDTWGYDGLWLDNLDLSLDRAAHEEDNSDGRVKEFVTDGAWQEAVKGWLEGVRARFGNWPVWANLISSTHAADSWDAYAAYLDGAMDESFSVRWVDQWLSASEWETQMARAERWLALGKGLVMVGQGPQEDKARMLFTLGSYLLAADGQQAFFRYTRFDSYYDALWLYPEFNTARSLGMPTGPRHLVSPGVWQRSFEHGVVQVNLNDHTARLALSSP